MVKQPLPPTPEELVSAWNDVAVEYGLRVCRTMTSERIKHLNARKKESFWRDNWEKALRLIPKNAFFLGENDRGWVANIEWFLRPNTVARLIEREESSEPKGMKRGYETGEFKF